MATESALGRAFAARLPLAIPDARIFRRNVVGAQIGDRFVAAGIKGQADYYLLLRGGLHAELELKSARGRLSVEQVRWREFCIAWNIPYFLLEQLASETPDETVNRWVSTLLGWTRSLP